MSVKIPGMYIFWCPDFVETSDLGMKCVLDRVSAKFKVNMKQIKYFTNKTIKHFAVTTVKLQL